MPLADLGTLKNGMNYNKSASIQGCKIIGVADFQNNVFPDYSDLAEIDSSIVSESDLLQNGDIVFVRSNGNKKLVGRSMLITNLIEPVCYSGFCISLRPNREVIFPEYLFYALRSPFCRQQYSYSQQTNITNLSQTVLGSVKTPIVPYSQQKTLSKILYDIDKKITLNKRINAELEATAKTLYDYWFVQFDFPDENGKPYRTSGGAMEYNEQLKREIPKGWNASKIESLLAKVPNTERIQTTDYHNEGKIPVIDQSTDFIAGYTDNDGSLIQTKKGAIVFGDHTRIVKYIGFEFARGADGTQVILSNSPSMPELLLYHAIQKIDLSNYGYARHFKFLKDTSIVIPNRSVAKSFEDKVTPLYAIIKHNIFENFELTRLRDWLLPMLMNGQATVE